MTPQEKLIEQVNASRQEYVTDGYAMSIGEIVSLDFPRYYRQLLFGSDLVEERVASNSSGD